MLRKIPYFLLIFLLSGCFAKKKTTYGKERKLTVAASKEKKVSESKVKTKPITKTKSTADKIIGSALNFSGVPYKYGGTTASGMDCSGLLYVAFGEHNIALPRVSYNMAEEGKQVRVKDLVKGDLLFFKTSKKGKRINHVGMVVSADKKDVKFIHVSSSRGVIISSLHEGYWNYAFVKATRVL